MFYRKPDKGTENEQKPSHFFLSFLFGRLGVNLVILFLHTCVCTTSRDPVEKSKLIRSILTRVQGRFSSADWSGKHNFNERPKEFE